MTEEEVAKSAAKARVVATVLCNALDSLLPCDAVEQGTVLCMMLAVHCSEIQFHPGHTLKEYLDDHIESVEEMLADIQASEQTQQ